MIVASPVLHFDEVEFFLVEINRNILFNVSKKSKQPQVFVVGRCLLPKKSSDHNAWTLIANRWTTPSRHRPNRRVLQSSALHTFLGRHLK